MADFEDSIPEGTISICNAFDVVCRTITPDSKVMPVGKSRAATINPACVQVSGCEAT